MSITAEDAEALERLYIEGRFAELETAARKLTDRHPQVGFCWSVLGAALQAQGKPSLHAQARAAELLPEDASAQASLGDALFNHADYRAAIAAYQRALALVRAPALLNNLGNAQKAAGDLQSAQRSYEEATQLDPQFALALYNLGLCHRDQAHLDAAIHCLRQATLADTAMAAAHAELGALHKAQGDLDAALASTETAVSLNPNLVEARINLGALLVIRGSFHAALAALEAALQLAPQSADATKYFAFALEGLGRTDEALEQFQAALRLHPNDAQALSAAANLLALRGDLAQALQMLGTATQCDPANVQAASSLVFYNAHTDMSAQAQFDAHVRLGQQLQQRIQPLRSPALATAASGRPLRVGLVSGDFCNHIVARCLVPVMQVLAESPQLQLFTYYNHHTVDDWTHRVRALSSAWRVVVGMTPASIAAQIQQDGIDVLLDLSGHTGNHLLEVFAYHPAPVQASWLGYPWTTGLSHMDYYLADRHWLAEGRFDSLFTERIAYLPAWLPFSFQGKSPDVGPLPAYQGDRFVFGSFNHFRKINGQVLSAWAEVLRQVPHAVLALGGIDSQPQQDRLTQEFSMRGIESARLVFHRRCLAWDYLQLHNAMDLCLDTFPFPSATTIQHALWMGVPTISVQGATPIACAGAGILRQLALDEFVAHSASDYVALAVQWSRQREALGRIRQGLRQRLLSTPMAQPRVVAQHLENELRAMHARHTLQR